jgi:hypothetical protein
MNSLFFTKLSLLRIVVGIISLISKIERLILLSVAGGLSITAVAISEE